MTDVKPEHLLFLVGLIVHDQLITKMPSAFVKIMLCWALGCIFGLVYALGDIEESMSQATLMNCLIFFPEKNS